MPVGGRDLAGLDHLHAAKERIGNVSGTGQPGIFQHEHAPLGLLGRNEVDRSHKLRAHILVAPDCRERSRARAHARRALPQRSCIEVPDIPRKAGEFSIKHKCHRGGFWVLLWMAAILTRCSSIAAANSARVPVRATEPAVATRARNAGSDVTTPMSVEMRFWISAGM